MPEIKVKIENIDKIRNAFIAYPEIVGPFLRDASMKSAFTIEGNSKKNTPVDTGRLKASIATSLGILNRGITSVVQTNVFYAVFVHEGTKYMRKRPFMEQGVEMSRSQIAAFYKNAMEKAFKKIADLSK